MLLVYTEKKTNRIKYIFELMLAELGGLDFELTTNREEYEACNGPKMNYSASPSENEIFIAPTGLLKERGISSKDLTFIKYEELPAFFPTYHSASAIPFDPFAAGFYLVSRFEEYLPFMKDEYGRFSANESIALKNNFLHKPMVNIWAKKISNILQEKYPDLKFRPKKFKFRPTIDVDAVYAHLEKGMFRSAGGYINALLNRDFKEISEKTRVLLKLENDPFDTFDYQLELQKKYNLNPIYFVLFGDYGLNDKNISYRNRKFRYLIKSLADYAEVGIHPSFASNQNPDKLKAEVNRLSNVLKREIIKSRQHFLILNLPVTYRNLINLDITDDYSMGFASMPGFRAGICDPYYFYDLDLDIKTSLRVHPFTVMDGTLKDYMGIKDEEVPARISGLIDEVKKVNGTFISIWHNESLSDKKRWKGWRNIYEGLIKTAIVGT